MSKELYNMKLHDSLSITPILDVVRVPGGWVYRTAIQNNTGHDLSQCFVPYDNGFDTRKFPKGK